LRRTAFFALLTAGWLAVGPLPLYSQKKDTLLLMRQLDTLQQIILSMQKTLDSQTAVLRTLVEQTNDNVNSMKATVNELKGVTERSLASNNVRFDSMTTQIQTLNESLEEAKTRIAKLSEQVGQTQNIIQTLHVAPTAEGLAAPGQGGSAKPDATTLYNSGLSAYNSGQYPLAMQAFQDLMFRGASIADVGVNLAILAGFAAVLFAAGLARFSFAK